MIGIGFLSLFVAMFMTTAYDYITDPRPGTGTVECEAAQEAIFKDPARMHDSPTDFVQAVNSACKQ